MPKRSNTNACRRLLVRVAARAAFFLNMLFLLLCHCCTLLLELQEDGAQYHAEKQVDGKRGKELPEIEAEKCMVAHGVGKQQGEEEPPDQTERKPPEERAAARDDPLPLEHTKDETKHPSQH